MNTKLLLNAAFLIIGAVVPLECNADCWPDLLEEQAGISLALDRRNFDSDRLEAERAELRELLGSCRKDAAFYYSPPDNFPAKHSYSLIGIAISADDPEMTKELMEQLRHSTFAVPDDLVYGEQYVSFAAHMESVRALKILLDSGVYLAGTHEQNADYALYSSRVFTAAGLEIVKLLVDAGANIEAGGNGRYTQTQRAATSGDLAKVQCLYSLGATMPDSAIVDEAIARDFPLDSKEALEATRDFLASHVKKIPEGIQDVCSSGTK